MANELTINSNKTKVQEIETLTVHYLNITTLYK